jgi:hypothetical protein
MKKILLALTLFISIATFANGNKKAQLRDIDENICTKTTPTSVDCPGGGSVVIAQTIIRYNCTTMAFIDGYSWGTGNTCSGNSVQDVQP